MGHSDKTYVVTIDQFLKHLSKHAVNFPAKEIAEKAGVPRSIVYNALDGQNVTLKTLRAMAKALGCEVVIMVKPGASNPLAPPPAMAFETHRWIFSNLNWRTNKNGAVIDSSTTIANIPTRMTIPPMALSAKINFTTSGISLSFNQSVFGARLEPQTLTGPC